MRIKLTFGITVSLLILTMPIFAQDNPSTNDIITKMKTALNLSDDQVTNITQVMERYRMASQDLQKSIEDNTINPSAIDSQKQQLKAQEEQGIAQYLRPDQLNEWRQMEGQMDKQQNSADGDSGADEYSNLPHNAPSQ